MPLKDKLSTAVSKAKQRVAKRQAAQNDETVRDQLKARKERARIEGRREGRKERRQQEIEQTRREAREAVSSARDQGGGILSQAAAALQTAADDVDLDGDGVALADELAGGTGGQRQSSSQSARQQSQPTGQPPGQPPGASGVPGIEDELAALETAVGENDREIERLEAEIEGATPGFERQNPGSAGRAGGAGAARREDEESALERMGFSEGDLL